MTIEGNTILRFEPYFDKKVATADIDHERKTITPYHGYCKPHKHGKANEKYAKKIGYEFKNY